MKAQTRNIPISLERYLEAKATQLTAQGSYECTAPSLLSTLKSKIQPVASAFGSSSTIPTPQFKQTPSHLDCEFQTRCSNKTALQEVSETRSEFDNTSDSSTENLFAEFPLSPLRTAQVSASGSTVTFRAGENNLGGGRSQFCMRDLKLSSSGRLEHRCWQPRRLHDSAPPKEEHDFENLRCEVCTTEGEVYVEVAQE